MSANWGAILIVKTCFWMIFARRMVNADFTKLSKLEALTELFKKD